MAKSQYVWYTTLLVVCLPICLCVWFCSILFVFVCVDKVPWYLFYCSINLCLCGLGGALVDVGESMKRLAEVKDSLDIDVKQNFIDPLQGLCDKDLREIQVYGTL